MASDLENTVRRVGYLSLSVAALSASAAKKAVAKLGQQMEASRTATREIMAEQQEDTGTAISGDTSGRRLKNTHKKHLEAELKASEIDFVSNFGEVLLEFASNYHGGYPNMEKVIDYGKLRVHIDGISWVKSSDRLFIPFEAIVGFDRDNFRVSIARNLLVGFVTHGHSNGDSANQFKTILVVSCDMQNRFYEIRFDLAPSAWTLHQSSFNVDKIINSTTQFRHLFAKKVQTTKEIVDPVSNPGKIVDELQKLAELYKAGLINDEEFEAFKKSMINS